jgi:hypothetical protein
MEQSIINVGLDGQPAGSPAPKPPGRVISKLVAVPGKELAGC